LLFLLPLHLPENYKKTIIKFRLTTVKGTLINLGIIFVGEIGSRS